MKRLAFWVERLRWPILIALSVIYFVGSTVGAGSRPLSFEEYAPLSLARLPSVGEEWRAIASGADDKPPLFQLATRASVAFAPNSLVGIRIPSIVGFWVLCLSLYFFVSRGMGAVAGLAAFLAPILTGFEYYAFKGEGYGQMAGFLGLAMVAWQRRVAWACAVCLCCAALSDTSAVPAILAFATAELVRSRETRERQWSMWVAFAAPLIPLAAWLYLIAKAPAPFRGGMELARWGSIVEIYSASFRTFSTLAVILLGAGSLLLVSHLELEPAPRKLRNDELALGLGLLLLPVPMIAAKIATHGYYHYLSDAMASVGSDAAASIGLVLVFISAVAASRRFGARMTMLALIVEAGLVVKLERSRVRYFLAPKVARSDAVRETDLAVYVHDPGLYVRLLNAWPKEQVARLRYVVDPESELRYRGQFTRDESLLNLARWAALTIDNYQAVRRGPRQFLLCYSPGQQGWLLDRLTDDGNRLELLEQYGFMMIFRVTQR